jgi:hypothetical protein
LQVSPPKRRAAPWPARFVFLVCRDRQQEAAARGFSAPQNLNAEVGGARPVMVLLLMVPISRRNAIYRATTAPRAVQRPRNCVFKAIDRAVAVNEMRRAIA